MRPRCAFPIGLVLAALAPSPAARALTPGKRLDQYAHAAWPSVAHASAVRALASAGPGQIWFGTSEGLVGWDGQRLGGVAPGPVPALVERDVRSLLIASDGALWVGSFGGVARVRADGGGWQTQGWPGSAGAPGGRVLALIEAPGGVIWAGGQGGIARFVPHTDPARAPTRMPMGPGLGDDWTHALARGGQPTAIWAGTRAGLARWGGTSWELVAGPPRVRVDALLGEPDGVWAGTAGQGLWHGRGGTWRGFSRAEGLAADEVRALLRDRAGRLWVATNRGGLAWLDGERFRAFPLPASLCGDRIEALAEDGEGGLWIGTETCGAHRLADRPLAIVTAKDGLPSDLVLGLGPDGDRLVVGTRGGGMARLDPGTGAIERLACPAGLPCDECWDFSARAAGGFLTVCRQNVVLRAGAGGVARYGALPGELAAASFALEARDGAHWFALGPKVVRAAGGAVTSFAPPELSGGYRILYQGRAGEIWIGGDDGLVRWEQGATRVVRLPAGERPAEVANFHEDAAGTLWMATKGQGIRRLGKDGTRIATIGIEAGLPSGWIVQLLEDGHGRLWASSSKGIFSVARRELDEVAAGRRARVHPSLYDAHDGIHVRSEPFGHPAGWKDARGRLWFATNRGLVTIEPGAPAPGPAVSVAELRLGGQAVTAVTGTAIDLEAAFFARSFAPEGTVTYRYRVGSAPWIELGARRSLAHAGLAPGAHLLEIAARTRESEWGPPARVGLTVRKPFRDSAAFVGLAVLVAGLAGFALLFAVHRVRVGRLRAQMAAVMAERARLAREVHDTLAQAFVATSVQLECLEEALERDPRGAGDDPRIRRHLGTAKRVVEESIEEARRAVWVLRPQAIESGLVPALETLVERVTGGTAVALEVAGEQRALPPLVASNLLRIAHEAVANAHRHAHARQIQLRVAFAADRVTLTVADDGDGLPSPASDQAAARTGTGLRGMQERAEEINAVLSIRSTKAAAARGTTVSVEVAA